MPASEKKKGVPPEETDGTSFLCVILFDKNTPWAFICQT
jgi:hypothetical protein